MKKTQFFDSCLDESFPCMCLRFSFAAFVSASTLAFRAVASFMSCFTSCLHLSSVFSGAFSVAQGLAVGTLGESGSSV